MTVYVEFCNVPKGETSERFGPFEYVNMIYTELYVQKPGADEPEMFAHFDRDAARWVADSGMWTDFTVSPEGVL
jgi:hypothetical protein